MKTLTWNRLLESAPMIRNVQRQTNQRKTSTTYGPHFNKKEKWLYNMDTCTLVINVNEGFFSDTICKCYLGKLNTGLGKPTIPPLVSQTYKYLRWCKVARHLFGLSTACSTLSWVWAWVARHLVGLSMGCSTLSWVEHRLLDTTVVSNTFARHF